MEAVTRENRLLLALLLLAALLASSFYYAAAPAPAAAWDGGPVKLFVDGAEIETDVPPLLEDGVTLVPVRFVSEALGAAVAWDEETGSVFVSGPAAVALRVGSKQACVDGRQVELLHEPVVVDGRTMVPVRFVAEAFGCEVQWDDGKVMIWMRPSPGGPAQPAPKQPVIRDGTPVDTVPVEWK